MLGEFGEDSINQVRADLQQRQQRRPRATTFRSGAFLAVDYLRFLLSVDDYDPDSDAEFAHLLRDRLTLEVHVRVALRWRAVCASLPRAGTRCATHMTRPPAVVGAKWTTLKGLHLNP